VFLTTTLFAIPLAAFYPYAPTNLHDLGFAHTSAWMSLAQCSEVIGMFSLGWLLLNWRVKWIFACGLGIGIVRFSLSALNVKIGLLAGIFLHGGSFTLVFITAAIYLDQRIEPAWRTRAQALLALMNNGVGNLIGYLGTGWWFNICTHANGTHWPIFWGGLTALVAGVMILFLAIYQTQGDGKLIKHHS
jgi:MFS family permease